MLDLIRKKKETAIIKLVFVVIVLSFIGTIFLVWGKGEEGMGGGGSSYAAKVNRTIISPEAYQNAYQNLVDTYRQIFGDGFTAEMEKQLDLRKQALDRLIDSVLITNAAKSVGVTVSKEDVASAIAAMPVFQENGRFDFGIYQQALKMNRITPEKFEETKKRELLLDRTRKAVTDKVVVSDEDALKQFHKEQDKLVMSYVVYSPADVAAEIRLSDQQLQEYLNQNAEQFMTDPRLALEWFVLENRPAETKSNATDEELETFYRRNLDLYMDEDNAPRPFEQVRNKVKVDQAHHQASKALYEKAADALFQNISSGDLKLVADKLGARVSETGLFTENAVPAPLASVNKVIERAFELEQGELGGPIETANGVYLFKVSQKKPAELLPLAQVRDKVEQQLRAVKSAELTREKAIEAQKAMSAGATGLKLQTSQAFGYDQAGTLPGIGSSTALMEKLFDLHEAGTVLDEPILVGDSWYAISLKQRISASKADFEADKEAIKNRLLPIRQDQALNEWLKELRSKAKIVINPALTASNN